MVEKEYSIIQPGTLVYDRDGAGIVTNRANQGDDFDNHWYIFQPNFDDEPREFREGWITGNMQIIAY